MNSKVLTFEIVKNGPDRLLPGIKFKGSNKQNFKINFFSIGLYASLYINSLVLVL